MAVGNHQADNERRIVTEAVAPRRLGHPHGRPFRCTSLRGLRLSQRGASVWSLVCLHDQSLR
jgi:hypothetical protein